MNRTFSVGNPAWKRTLLARASNKTSDHRYCLLLSDIFNPRASSFVSSSFGPSRVPITSVVNIRSKSNALSSSKHQISDSTLRKERNFAKVSLEPKIHLTRRGWGGVKPSTFQGLTFFRNLESKVDTVEWRLVCESDVKLDATQASKL